MPPIVPVSFASLRAAAGPRCLGVTWRISGPPLRKALPHEVGRSWFEVSRTAR